ncbi:MAG TPA: acyl-CoA desaturase [Saprospiraceae bacterium]|nr:acyl-CoA desaturase [Saprospiraceae bacterium]
MKGTPSIKFARVQPDGFSRELRKRINSYLREHNLKKQGGWQVYLKTLVWFTLYLGPYAILLTTSLSVWGQIAMVVLMGVAMCGIGLNTMHDANHGTYSDKGWVNKLAGASLAFMGGNPFIWRTQHNVLHHSFTNIQNQDEDIKGRYVLKFCPEDKSRWFHKFQHLYSPILYTLMTLIWAFHKDFVQLFRYRKMGLIERQKSSFRKELVKIIAIKIFYFGYMMVIPLVVIGIPFIQWLVGFLIMHATAGLLLSLVFQSAHVVEETTNPMPDENGKLKDEWMVHQLRTTANFATKSRWFNWFAGGLNFQIEHHLFPNISHIHYPALSRIVKECTDEYNLPYYEFPTMLHAVNSHFKKLRIVGSN